MRDDIAVPPILAEEKAPIIAPLFFSGRASTNEALKIELPTVFINAPKNANIHKGRNSVDKNAKTKNTQDKQNPIAIVQNLVLGLSLIMPKSATPTRPPIVHTDMR